MSWSPQQQAMLGAMGYTLYRPAAAADTPAAAVPAKLAGAVRGHAQAGMDGKLMQALQRAAGGRELSGLALPPLEVLRSDPAAKRRIWPALRALRRR